MVNMYTKVNHAEYNGLIRKLIGEPKKRITSVLVQRGKHTFKTREPKPGDIIYMPISYKKITAYIILMMLLLLWGLVYDTNTVDAVISYLY